MRQFVRVANEGQASALALGDLSEIQLQHVAVLEIQMRKRPPQRLLQPLVKLKGRHIGVHGVERSGQRPLSGPELNYTAGVIHAQRVAQILCEPLIAEKVLTQALLRSNHLVPHRVPAEEYDPLRMQTREHVSRRPRKGKKYRPLAQCYRQN